MPQTWVLLPLLAGNATGSFTVGEWGLTSWADWGRRCVLKAAPVFCHAVSMSKGFWLNHVEPNVFDMVFEDYLWLQKMVEIFHFSLVYKNLSSLPGFLSFGSKSRRFGGMFFFSGLYWSSGYQRCCFTTNLEISNENSGDLAMEFSIDLRSHGLFLDQAKVPRNPLKGVRWR